MKEFVRMKLVNVGLLRRNIKEEFEGVVNAAVELSFMDKDVKTIFKNELAIIMFNIDKTFEGKYLELDSELTSMYKF